MIIIPDLSGETSEPLLGCDFLIYSVTMKGEYIIVDIETTGLDPESAAIIEIGAILVKDGKIESEFSCFVEHKGELPESTKRVTHITEKMLVGAPPLVEVIKELQAFIKKLPVIAHNGFFFDFRILERDGLKIEEKYDSMELAFFVLPTHLTGHSMAALAGRFSLGEVPHRALADCRLEFEVITHLQRAWSEFSKEKATALKSLAERTGWWWASSLSGEHVAVSDFTALVKPYAPFRKDDSQIPSSEMQSLDPAEVEKFFLHTRHQKAQYAEDRPEQRCVARLIAESFSNDTHAVIEAGTGVGKSKAYLVPSILFALKNNIPVVISTFTKALQDQLETKEIPHVRELIKPDLRVAVLKGKQNYVCLKKFKSFADDMLTELSQRSLYEHSKSDTKFTTRLGFLLLSSWVLETERGDWDEIPYWLAERIPNRIKEDICNLDELCAPEVCDSFDAGTCFLAKARLRAKDADLIILNHAILLTGIRKRIPEETEGIESEGEASEVKAIFTHPVLPPSARLVVLDEAHHLEDAATSAWTLSLSQLIFERLLRQLYDEKRGVRFLMDRIIGDSSDSQLPDLGERFDGIEADLRLEVNTLFKEVLEKVIPPNPSSKWKQFLSFSDLAKVPSHMEPLLQILRSIEERLTQVRDILRRFSDAAKSENLKKGINIRANTVSGVLSAINKLLGEDPEVVFVRYIERDRSFVTMHAAPLSIANALKELVYDNFDAVVMTSATITVEDKFNFFATRCGTSLVEKDKVRYLQQASSFDYPKQVQFFTPSGIAYASDEVKKKAHFDKCLKFLEDAITASQGGALVLCSSHAQVESLYTGLRKPLSHHDIWLLRQTKDQSITSVVRDFTSDLNSTLIGTSALWQGVDVPGPSLRALFIYKIPYKNPREPLIQARCEEIEKRGGDGFGTYYEPLAAIELKQGFGRLIRKKTDIGIAVLLDEGIMRKPMLRRSFPQGVQIRKEEPNVILDALSRLAHSVNMHV